MWITVLPLLLARPAPVSGESCVLWLRQQESTVQEREAIQQAIVQAFAERGLPEPLFVGSALPPEELAARAGRAQQLLEQARDEYRRFESDAALASVGAAREALAEGCGVAPSDLALSIELLEGMIHFSGGNREQAERAFARLFELDAEYTPDENVLSPKIVALLSQIRVAVQARPASVLVVRVLPADAEVRLDGRVFGGAAHRSNLPAGEHCLSVSHPLFLTAVQRLRLSPGQQLSLDVVLSPVLEGREEFRSIAGAVAARYGSDWMIWLEVVGDTTEVLFASAAAGAVPASVSCPPGDVARCVAQQFEKMRAARKQIVELPPPLAPPPQPVPAPVPSPEPVRPWYRQWWFWTSVGAAVATGVALGLAAALSADSPGYRIVLGRP
ncbi:MAG: PEGA domain-containing protein [Myxococcales bacterium]|nr:PEGA domain-containing protein [Myxococcales bacterium]